MPWLGVILAIYLQGKNCCTFALAFLLSFCWQLGVVTVSLDQAFVDIGAEHVEEYVQEVDSAPD